MPYLDIYEKFIDFFSIVPCLMSFPTKIIIQEEYKQVSRGQALKISTQVVNAFTPIILTNSYNFKMFMHNMQLNSVFMQIIQQEISQFSSIVDAWEQQRIKAGELLRQCNLPSSLINEDFYKHQEKDTILKDLRNHGIDPDENLDISLFPALRIMEYSQFNRIYLTQKKIYSNDVMDITISCIVPYLDAIITEGFQADVYKKAKG